MAKVNKVYGIKQGNEFVSRDGTPLFYTTKGEAHRKLKSIGLDMFPSKNVRVVRVK